MKIFANNFSLSFHEKPENPAYVFHARKWQDIKKKLTGSGPDFDWQTFHLETGSSGPAPKDLWELHTDPRIAPLKAEIVVRMAREDSIGPFMDAYAGLFKPVAAAGGAVINDRGELLMIFRDGKWDLPKGKVEKGESLDEAAIREVEEETGITGLELIRLLPQTLHIFYRNSWKLKTTHWWLMRSTGRGEMKPQQEEGITEVRWVPLEELRAELPETYPTITETIRAAIFPSA